VFSTSVNKTTAWYNLDMTNNGDVCPKPGHLVHGWTKLPYPGLAEVNGLVVDKRGIEVLVLTYQNDLVWVKRTDIVVVQ